MVFNVMYFRLIHMSCKSETVRTTHVFPQASILKFLSFFTYRESYYLSKIVIFYYLPYSYQALAIICIVTYIIKIYIIMEVSYGILC